MSLTIGETSIFTARHPELRPFLSQLMGTYTTCQGLTNDTDDLDKMYAHIYGNDEFYKGCKWCQETLKIDIEHAKKFFD